MTTLEPNRPPAPARNELLANFCMVAQLAVDVAGLVFAWWIYTNH